MEEKYFTRGEQSDGGDGDVVDGSLGPGLAVLGAGAGHQLAHGHQEPRHHLQLLVLGLGPARPGVNTRLNHHFSKRRDQNRREVNKITLAYYIIRQVCPIKH